MAIDTDDEILQDFLVEASEILELLGEQLIDLEHSPEDGELLNAIFRGFHTVKGGAGFLAIHHLVTICHKAEDLFNLLRQGDRDVNPTTMDAILQSLDVVNEMMESVQNGDEPEPASDELLATLDAIVSGTAAVAAQPEVVTSEPAAVTPDVAASTVAPGGEDITEEEFDNLLDEIHGKGKHSLADSSAPSSAPALPPSDSDDITEAEFDALLDQLHGDGKVSAKTPAPVAPPAQVAPSSNSEDITDDEFDNLLDEIHGKGKHGNVSEAEPAAVAPVAAPKAEPSPVAAPKAAVPAPKKAEPAKASAPKSAAKESVKPKAETTVRVDTARLDNIMNMVGELVLVRNRLDTLKANIDDEHVSNAVANLDVVTSDLQIAVMKTRMQPIKKVFGRFPRVVRDLARNLKKDIDLVMVGEDTDLDKNLVESLADPLIHLVRNSVDHGIEIPADRIAAGKPEKGIITLSANQEGDHILLSIEDDGKGMDANFLREIVVSKGLMDQETANRLDDKECYNLIFMPGFSTKTEISDVSGRGVGMDVVKTRITQMNGTVEIDSELGRGSLIIIKLPLTLAILPTLMVILGTQPFALPLANVVEIFNLDLSHTNMVDGRQTIRVRDRAIPLFHLSTWLVGAPEPSTDKDGECMGHVVVVNIAGSKVGLVVDQLIGQEEVVIKPLGALLQNVDGMAGATITGDGQIALIMDVPGLMRKYARRF